MSSHPLKRLRQTLGITQAALAAKLGVDPAAVTMYETGRNAMSRRIMVRLIDLYRDQLATLGITPEDLLRSGPPFGADQHSERVERSP